jgi:hypothetical protein
LLPRHRAFVLAYLETDPPNATEAARRAGYKDHPNSRTWGSHHGGAIRVMACRLMQRDDVKAALIEECRRRLAWDLPIRIRTVAKIANDPQHRDSLRANLALMNRGGLPDIRETTVRHEMVMSEQEKWAKIIEIYTKLGLPLPAGAPKIVDVSSVEVNSDGTVRIGDENY